jgi:hypothetical protein
MATGNSLLSLDTDAMPRPRALYREIRRAKLASDEGTYQVLQSGLEAVQARNDTNNGAALHRLESYARQHCLAVPVGLELAEPVAVRLPPPARRLDVFPSPPSLLLRRQCGARRRRDPRVTLRVTLRRQRRRQHWTQSYTRCEHVLWRHARRRRSYVANAPVCKTSWHSTVRRKFDSL